MLIDNLGITEGDQAFITSPQFEAQGEVTVRLYTYITISDTDFFSHFSVNLLNSAGRYMTLLEQ